MEETASNQELETDSSVFSERVVKEKPNLIMSIKDVPHSGWQYSIYLACRTQVSPDILDLRQNWTYGYQLFGGC